MALAFAGPGATGATADGDVSLGCPVTTPVDVSLLVPLLPPVPVATPRPTDALPLELELNANSPLTVACPCAARIIPSGRQAWLDAMEPQLDGTPPTFEKSKQLQPEGQAWPEAQSKSLGRQFMVTVVPQVGGVGAGQVSPAAQAPPDPVHQLDSLTFTHW